MIKFKSFLLEAEEAAKASGDNTALGAAYETATALHLHNSTGSKNNKDAEHVKRIQAMEKLHKEAMAKLPPEKQKAAVESGKRSAEAYMNSLKTNHGIDPKHVHEVHHTYAGIDHLVGKKVDRAGNPHDVAIKTKDGKIHGASLKFKPGTLSNSTHNSFDKLAQQHGIDLNTKSHWDEHMKKAGLAGKSGKEIKAVRKDAKVLKLNTAAQNAAGAHHADAFNKADHTKVKKFMQSLMKSNPHTDYDYVVGSKGTSEPIKDKKHYQLVNKAKSFKFDHTGNGKVRVTDHAGNHLMTFEHRPTHGAFSSIQVNGKLGTAK